MNCAPAGGAKEKADSTERRRATARNRRAARGRAQSYMKGSLSQEDPRPPDLLGRDHAQEVRQEPVHELEKRGERRDLLLLSVEDLFRELLLVEGLAGAPVDEVEIRAQAVALPLEVAVAPHEAGPVGPG